MEKQLVLAQDGQDETLQPHPRVVFVERQEERLHRLISEGHLCVGSRSLVWVDENGLLTAQNMSGNNLPKSTSFFHAGPHADANEISNSLTVPRHDWGQEDLGKEATISGSLLEKLIMKEIKHLPVITHVAWKGLLADLESSTATHTLESLESKLHMAIRQEEEDWHHLRYTIAHADDPRLYPDLNLTGFCQGIHRIAGVNPYQSDPLAALREINACLANEISTACDMANKMQTGEIAREELPLLAYYADQLECTLWKREMRHRMRNLLEAVIAKTPSRAKAVGYR